MLQYLISMKKIFITFIFLAALSSCSTSSNVGNYQEEPYPGYNDGYDQDCSDIGQMVQLPYYDPDGLDADGDGWGCESYGG